MPDKSAQMEFDRFDTPPLGRLRECGPLNSKISTRTKPITYDRFDLKEASCGTARRRIAIPLYGDAFLAMMEHGTIPLPFKPKPPAVRSIKKEERRDVF
jgi:hypothetical protein